MRDKKNIDMQELIFLIFHNISKIHGRTYLQKLIFIIQNELKISKFNYDAYFYGPYSKELNDEMAELVKSGLLKETIQTMKDGTEYYSYSLTPQGEKYYMEQIEKNIDAKLKEKIEEICNRFRSFTPTQLLKFVYQLYPKSASKSVFFD